MSAPDLILICDPIPLDDSQKSMLLYMTAQEQLDALLGAGFADVRVALSIDKPKLYAGCKSGST